MRPSSRPELPGPGPDRTRDGPDRTRDGPDRTRDGPDRTSDGPDRTRDGPDRTGSSWFPGPGKDLLERRDASRVDRRSRARKRGQRDASLSSSSSSVSEYRRESRRDRHRRRHGRSRRRYRSVTPPQAATLTTEQILRAIADVKRATDAVVTRVDSLERGGAVSAGASPLPSVAEQDISLGPAQDDFLSSDEEEGSREWRPRHGGGETPSEVVAVAREGVTTASRSTPLEAESVDCAPPSGDADTHRYRDTIKAVFAYNPNITPQPLPVDDVFGGELMALCQETQREECHPSIPSSGLLSSALRFTGGGDGGGVTLTSR